MRESIIEDLIIDEGKVLRKYICPTGYPTIGVGRNLQSPGLSVEESAAIGTDSPSIITEDQAILLLNNDIDRVESELADNFPWSLEMCDARWMALVNMCFQLGLPTLMRFRKTITFMEEGDWKGASKEMLDSVWARQTPHRAKRQSERIRTGEL